MIHVFYSYFIHIFINLIFYLNLISSFPNTPSLFSNPTSFPFLDSSISEKPLYFHFPFILTPNPWPKEVVALKNKSVDINLFL